MVRKKVQITINIHPNLKKWIGEKLEDYTFGSISHAVEQALYELKKKMEKKKS